VIRGPGADQRSLPTTAAELQRRRGRSGEPRVSGTKQKGWRATVAYQQPHRRDGGSQEIARIGRPHATRESGGALRRCGRVSSDEMAVGTPRWCTRWGRGGGKASCAINREFKAKGIGCHEAWLSSALRPGGMGKLRLEHGGAELEVQRGRSASRLEDKVVFEVN
jgi:hypothetical protein